MKLRDLSEAAINELNVLAEASLDITSAAVMTSVFYRAIQTEEVLDSAMSNLPPATLLLVAQIAAKSPTIHTVYISGNNLGEHGPATAAALAKSHTLERVDISYNHLDTHAPATAAAFSESHSLIYIVANDESTSELPTLKEIIDRNLALLTLFANKLIETKDQPCLNKSIIKHLGHLGPITKDELTKILTEKTEETLPLIIEKPSKYFADNFLQILGVCKEISYGNNTDLPELPVEILTHIGSFLSLEDFNMTAQLEEVDLTGT